MKEAGFNAIRSSHNPASEAMLRACDELGMYVMDETFDTWYNRKNKYDYGCDFEAWWEADTTAMVERDYNHPSVIRIRSEMRLQNLVKRRDFRLEVL